MPRFFILEKEMVILNPIFCTDQSDQIMSQEKDVKKSSRYYFCFITLEKEAKLREKHCGIQ